MENYEVNSCMTESYKFKFENIKLTDAVRLMLNGNESLGHLKF